MSIKNTIKNFFASHKYFFEHEVKMSDGKVVYDKFVLKRLYHGRTDLSSYVEDFTLEELEQLKNELDKILNIK